MDFFFINLLSPANNVTCGYTQTTNSFNFFIFFIYWKLQVITREVHNITQNSRLILSRVHMLSVSSSLWQKGAVCLSNIHHHQTSGSGLLIYYMSVVLKCF